jgi:chemosensory pili system protein ChpA (sensor histidine kinase/response regulator)
MPQDKELEIQLQFLEEVQDHLNLIESNILGISSNKGIDSKGMDAVLRSAHSIKGGAAMMGFQTLSDLAHRLENFFKVLKTQKTIDTAVESLLLAAVDCLRQAISANHQASVVDEQWLASYVDPVFEQLHQRLGDPDPEEIFTPSAQDEQDMVRMLFETEVEGYLQQLESVLANPEKSDLLAEVSEMAQELSDLAEMLQVDAFKNLCISVKENLEATPEASEEIAHSALQAWRRSQAAVLVGQIDTLPDTLDLDRPTSADVSAPEIVPASIINSSIATINTASVSRVKPDAATNPDLKENQENTVRVPLKQLEQLNDLFGELTIERSGLDLQLERLRNSVKILERKVRSLQQAYTRRRSTAYQKSAKPANALRETTLLSDVAFSPSGENLFSKDQEALPNQSYNKSSGASDRPSEPDAISSEVVANFVQLQEVTEDIDLCLQETDQIVGDLNRTAKQLQYCINQLRMRPFSDLVGRFPRALRELALQYGKNVELKIQGDDTLIERSILDALNNPLMHLLRNAFDHGIEDPETRRSCGKPEQGAIEIKAAYRGNQTLITFRDDGRGIALDKVRSRAQQLGLDAEAIASASDREILTLIFEPGFSTAEQVTALSGRGVGMDVVRTNLSQIHGDIQVDTQLGVGTTFTISVPLTLSVARVLLVESKDMLLAFPTTAIEEMLLLNSEQISTIDGKAVLQWKEYTIPLIYLSDWLKFRCPQVSSDAEAVPLMGVPTVLIVAQGNGWVGIQVERCWGEQEVAIRSVEGAIPMPPGFTGCTILGDGRVVPLVNSTELLDWIATCQQSSSLEQELQTGANAVQSQRPSILMVDDSINVRRFLSLTLEKAGYRVEQAKDGLEALEKLLGGLQVNGVVCDIDMPRLDGYGFLARVKSNPAFKKLPIVMLTSRNGHKERQLALNLGATAYFSKPYNKQELLEALDRLIVNS